MAKYKIIIITLAFLAALFASLSLSDWGESEKQAYSFEPREGLRMPESGIGDVGF